MAFSQKHSFPTTTTLPLSSAPTIWTNIGKILNFQVSLSTNSREKECKIP